MRGFPKNIKQLIAGGEKTRFKKGQKPWNFGLAKKYLCGSCRVEFKNKSHGRPKYCRACLPEAKVRIAKKNAKKRRGVPLTKGHVRKIVLKTRKIFKNKKPTSIEKIVYEELKMRGARFEVQKAIGGRFIVDAYIPAVKLVIECDGEYWHSREDNKLRDRRKDLFVKTMGYKLLRLPEKEIKDGSFKHKLSEELI